MFKLEQEKYWAGTSNSYWAAIDAQEKAEAYLTANNKPMARGDLKSWIDDMLGPVYQPEGSVGVVNIKGSLVNGSSGVARLYGVLGYDDIREALTEAVADKNIKTILLNIDSGGGQVAGVQELADYVLEIGKVKPTSSYSSTTMASAAYWLGAAADSIGAGGTALVGSIGVLMIHQEVSKMMADAGVTTTIVRSGKYKALVNRYEPLSDLAKEEMQAQVDDIDAAFIGYVAKRRGVSADVATRKLGQGREFLGNRALDVGLVDQIASFSEMHLKSEASTASKKPNARAALAAQSAVANNATNVQEGTPMKVNLTAEQIAALASGTPPEQLGLTQEALAELQATLAEAGKKTVVEPPKAEPTKPGAGAGDDSVQTFLRNELRDVNATLATTQAALKTSEAALATVKAEHTSLLNIARGSIGNMQIAMGGRNTAATLADADVLAEHTRLADTFTKLVPSGGRVSAAVGKPEEESKAEAKFSPTVLAAMQQATQQF